MNRSKRLVLAATTLAFALSGCATQQPEDAFAAYCPDPQARASEEVQEAVKYVFSNDRRATLQAAYESAVWKPINLMIDGKIPYEIEGQTATEPETNAIKRDADFMPIKLPVTPDGWATISSTHPYDEPRLGIASIYAVVKLKDGEVDRSVTPDQISVRFGDYKSFWMNAAVIRYGDDQVALSDTVASLQYRHDFMKGAAELDIYEYDDKYLNIPSFCKFTGIESLFKIKLDGDTIVSVDDIRRADTRFVDALAKWNEDGSNWVQ